MPAWSRRRAIRIREEQDTVLTPWSRWLNRVRAGMITSEKPLGLSFACRPEYTNYSLMEKRTQCEVSQKQCEAIHWDIFPCRKSSLHHETEVRSTRRMPLFGTTTHDSLGSWQALLTHVDSLLLKQATFRCLYCAATPRRLCHSYSSHDCRLAARSATRPLLEKQPHAWNTIKALCLHF